MREHVNDTGNCCGGCNSFCEEPTQEVPQSAFVGLDGLPAAFSSVEEIGSNEDEWEVVTLEIPFNELGGES